MRILLYSRTFLPFLGGLEQASYVLARELSARCHEVTLATDVAAPAGFDERFGFRVLRGYSLTDLVKVGRGVDVIHTNGHSMLAFPLAFAARRPLVITHSGLQAACLTGSGFHDGQRCESNVRACARLTMRQRGVAFVLRQLGRHAAARASLRLAGAHVAVSRFVMEKIAAPRSSVIYNCADTTVFTPEPGRPAGARFLFVGRFVSEKGVDVLLHALALCARNGSPVELDLVGSGPLERDLRRLTSELGIQRMVSFRGRLHGSELAECMRGSLAVLVPTLSDEAFGIVAAEAMACGRIALVSRTGGLPEVVAGTDCAIPAGDIDAWASALLRAKADAQWRARTEAQLPSIAARFTETRNAEQYLSVYEQAIRDA